MCPEGYYCKDPARSPEPCPEGTYSSRSQMCIDHTQCIDIGSKAELMNTLLGTCSYKLKTNLQIKKLARSTSTGNCAKYVRKAVQLAQGLSDVGTGTESAKDLGPWLIKQGYSASSKSYTQAAVGDIAVMEGSPAHPHGHICVKCDDGRWRSDFVQKGFFPYKDGSQPDYIIYE